MAEREAKYKYSLTVKTPIPGLDYSSIGATVSVSDDDAEKAHSEVLDKAFELLNDAYGRLQPEESDELDEDETKF